MILCTSLALGIPYHPLTGGGLSTLLLVDSILLGSGREYVESCSILLMGTLHAKPKRSC